jgi:hypothetical protein
MFYVATSIQSHPYRGENSEVPCELINELNEEVGPLNDSAV